MSETKRKEAVKSANHLVFTRGSLGGMGEGQKGIDPIQAGPQDYEYFTDRRGQTVFRAKVSESLKLRKGNFMARVRWPAQMVLVGWDQAIYVANKHHGEIPEVVLKAEREAREQAAAARGSTSRKELNHSTPKTDSEMPEGWTVEIKETKSKRKYKVYHSPDGKKFQSFKKAQNHMTALAEINA